MKKNCAAKFPPRSAGLFPLLVLLGFTFSYLFGQVEKRAPSRLELIHASISRGEVRDGIPLKILEGDVHVRQDTLEIFCDRAVYDELGKKITLTGNVRLIRGKSVLTARRVVYFEERKLAIARGQVRINRPAQEMRCDYLEYYYETDQAFARGSLWMNDQTNRVYITAWRGEYLPQRSLAYVERRAHLWQVDSTGQDTLHIFSRRMEYYFGENSRAIALDSVHIYQENLHATCDSAVYLLDKDLVFLEKNPRAVQEENEIFGKEIQLVLEKMELKQILVKGGAKAISVVDSALKKENRLEGRQIIMYISNRKLTELWAVSNARSQYYLTEESEAQGVNVASADTIKIFLKDNELDSIAVIGGARGTYYPADFKGPITED